MQQKNIEENYRSGVSLTSNKALSSREASARDLRIFFRSLNQSAETKIGRCRITDFRHDSSNFMSGSHLTYKRCGGLFYNNGFTLIELLVVVLIIGILAAVALPQYQRAVDKSRFMKMVQVVYGIKRAQETYYLANGNYSADLTALDIDYTGGCQPSPDGTNMFTCPDGFYMDLWLAWGLPTGAFSVTFCPDHNTNFSECYSNKIASFSIYFDHYSSENWRGKSDCIGNTPRGEAICKSLQSMQ